MNETERQERLDSLVLLSRNLGTAPESFAILGEGNTSSRSGDDTFWVKGSGCSLARAEKGDFSECQRSLLDSLWGKKGLDDAAVHESLLAARIDPAGKKPSTEALFHSYLLSLPGVEWVAHTHPISVNSILCSPRAHDFAEGRLFPDEIVCGGEVSALVPYTDPGVPLAQAIREVVERHRKDHGEVPRIILLINHGLIATGPSAAAVEATTRMAEKAASIFLGAAVLGGPVFLPKEQVRRISGRPDEHYRRKMLRL